MTKKIAIYPGTFDPITKGHVDVIQRAARLFDDIIVGVAVSERKNTLFSFEKRLFFCKTSLQHIHHVSVLALSGLLVDFAKTHQANYIVRGIRTAEDVTYELANANMNRRLSKQELETIFLPASDESVYVSATLVREIIQLQGDVSAFVPACVVNDLRA